MRQRCEDPHHSMYPKYGGRGLTVCARWQVFANFLEDMGPRPYPSASIDRLNNSQGYGPGNCRWASKAEQARNRRSTRLTPQAVTELRALRQSGWSVYYLGDHYGLHPEYVRLVVTGQRWSL